MFGGRQQFSVKDLPSELTMKHRKPGQASAADVEQMPPPAKKAKTLGGGFGNFSGW